MNWFKYVKFLVDRAMKGIPFNGWELELRNPDYILRREIPIGKHKGKIEYIETNGSRNNDIVRETEHD